MKVIGVYNSKGGVGKTATAVNLAYVAALKGNRTLVWDLDPQAAASFYFRVKPEIEGGGKGLLGLAAKAKAGAKENRLLSAAIKGTDFENLDLLPGDFSLRNLDLVLEDAKRPTKQLSRLLKSLSDDYDLVFLDCPPSISLVSENVFRACEILLVPMIPTTLSARTLEQLQDFLTTHDDFGAPRMLPLFTMVDRRKRLHLEQMEELARQYADTLETHIPYASEVERMGIHRMPLPAYAPSDAVSQAYRDLWEEVERELVEVHLRP